MVMWEWDLPEPPWAEGYLWNRTGLRPPWARSMAAAMGSTDSWMHKKLLLRISALHSLVHLQLTFPKYFMDYRLP